MDHTNLIFPKQKSHPHPSLPPPDGGRDKVADTAKGRLKFKTWFQTTFSFFASAQYYKIRAAVDSNSNDD